MEWNGRRLRLIILVRGAFFIVLWHCLLNWCFLNLEYFCHLLSSSTMMHWCSPLIIELLACFTILLLLVSLLDKRMLKQLRPWEALTWGFIKESLKERFELWGHILWEFNWVLDNKVYQCVYGVGVKGRGAHEKFIYDDTQRPKIHRVIVRELLHKLGCHVKGRTLDWGQHNSVSGHGTGKPKVTKLYNAVSRNQDILRLHISVNDAVTVKIVECVHKLLSYLANLGFWQVSVILKNFEEFTLCELCNNAEFVRCFERVQQQNDVFMI